LGTADADPQGGQRRNRAVPTVFDQREMVGTLSFAHPTIPARLPHLPLIPDRAEMLVDAEDDQDEFRGDARKHHADHDTGD
jgi:hypothetical protein